MLQEFISEMLDDIRNHLQCHSYQSTHTLHGSKCIDGYKLILNFCDLLLKFFFLEAYLFFLLFATNLDTFSFQVNICQILICKTNILLRSIKFKILDMPPHTEKFGDPCVRPLLI